MSPFAISANDSTPAKITKRPGKVTGLTLWKGYAALGVDPRTEPGPEAQVWWDLEAYIEAIPPEEAALLEAKDLMTTATNDPVLTTASRHLEPLQGIQTTALPFKAAFVRDLEWFEGPLLSELRTEDGASILMRWCDMDKTAHRWMVLHVDAASIEDYLTKKIDILSLLNPLDGFFYFSDMYGANTLRVTRVVKGQVPDVYLPEAAVYYDDCLAPKGDHCGNV